MVPSSILLIICIFLFSCLALVLTGWFLYGFLQEIKSSGVVPVKKLTNPEKKNTAILSKEKQPQLTYMVKAE